jgi:signal transduction histidine kinase
LKSRWRIRHKLAAGLVLVVGMVSILSAGSFYGLYSYRRSNKTFDYHQQQLALLGYLELSVAALNFPNDGAQEKADRLARVEAMVEKYRAGLQLAVDRRLTAPETAAQQFAELSAMNEILGRLRAANPQPRAAANRVESLLLFPGSERDMIAELATTLQLLRGSIHAEVTQRVDADRDNYRTSLAIVYSSTVLVLAMLFLLVWLGYRLLFHPIRELHRGVGKLAAGNFDSRLRVDSGDEMQELAEAFNDMADKLHAIYRDLNRQVEERSRQLIRSERLASVGFLAAGVAHEINNPLASIAFCGEALDGRLKQIVPPDSEDAEVVQNYLHMIQQEAFRCKTITEKLLDFSRAGEPERVDTDVLGLVRGVVEMVQHMGRTKGKRVLFDPAEPVVARVNPQELKQVLLNLLVNALESVDEGGWVRIRAAQTEDGVEIVVEDNGVGMSEEVLENVFEPFFTRNRTGKGTGLGLSISHLIISQHGGTISAASDGPGKGARMTVRLPAPALAHAA